MSFWILLKRSLRHYRRTHLGIALGVMVATTVIAGALVVGDSVRFSLRATALSRVGDLQHAVVPQDRYFRAELADELQADLDTPVLPLLMLHGVAVSADQSSRANRVQIIGVPTGFWEALAGSSRPQPLAEDSVLLNTSLAVQLKAQLGDEILLRIDKPDPMPREAPLATVDDTTLTARVQVAEFLGEGELGNFSFQANQLPPRNAFVPLEWLQDKTELERRANSFLLSQGNGSAISLQQANDVIARHWRYDDAELGIRELPQSGVVELTSRRIFLDPPLGELAATKSRHALGVLTYFVNELRVGERATPYSMVTALGHLTPPGNTDTQMNLHRILPSGIPADGIVINQWLAEDLQADEHTSLTMRYYVVGTSRRLEERENAFQVQSILPMDGPGADPDWMPNFPGLSDVENCRNWEPGVPIDLDRIRDKDEGYWDEYRGTPKAFLTLSTGQSLWENRFGNLTAIRYPLTEMSTDGLAEFLHENLEPSQFGLFFQPIRERVLAASAESLDFGQLFLGLSFFLIVSALLLTGLLFVFAVEQRTAEVGLLKAVGLPARTVRRLMLSEGAVLALIGTIVGTGAGMLYTKAVLTALASVWAGAVAGSVLRFHAEGMTLLIGALASFVLAVATMMLALVRYGRLSARQLLSGNVASTHKRGAIWWKSVSFWLGTACVWIALESARRNMADTSRYDVGMFFLWGSLLLMGGLLLVRSLLLFWEHASARHQLTLPRLGLRNTARRRGRSLATVALLACGCFLIVAVSANRQDAVHGNAARTPGTGGFGLFAESSLPIVADLNTSKGRDTYGLSGQLAQDTRFVNFRVREGDDASCLNLNRAQAPRLLGLPVVVDQIVLLGRFSFAEILPGVDNPWLMLGQQTLDGVVPAIADQATAVWALGKSLGDTLTYRDENGKAFDVRLVALLSNSVFQGNLIIGEEPMLEHFPSLSGYRMFLIDTPSDSEEQTSQALMRGLEDWGMEVGSASGRLAQFNVVQNTYLSIFQALGGLGMLLGSIGLGIVVLRNILERRGELALLRAVGFPSATINRMLMTEHWGLLMLGVLCGVVAAVVAVFPALRTPGAQIPWLSLGITLLAIAGSGVLWIGLSARAAMRGTLLNALRDE